MERIASFTINHLNLMPGLYVSRRDAKGDCVTTTFDLRITAPNREPVIDTPALHTIEHLAATYLRNCESKEDVIYFGPMGCRTGCYLVMFGNLDSEDIYDLVMDLCDFIIGFEGEIPGAAPEQCGNYQEQNLDMAKYYIRKYRDSLKKDRNLVYPEQNLTEKKNGRTGTGKGFLSKPKADRNSFPVPVYFLKYLQNTINPENNRKST